MNTVAERNRLPLESLHPGPGKRRSLDGLVLAPEALARFNRLLVELRPEAPEISADQVATLGRWLLSLPPARAEAVLAERLCRAEPLRRMLTDDDWEAEPGLRERSALLLGYLQEVHDLIPDHLPLIGRLDDALLVELAWDSFAAEAADYQDFCRFRSERRPRGTPAERRLAWENAVLAEAALLQQRRELRARPYAAGEPLRPMIRVS
ncbi:YkvA family protein [Arenimonas fontis]|nr:YkvA family protein [Arenimonas fontis]